MTQANLSKHILAAALLSLLAAASPAQALDCSRYYDDPRVKRLQVTATDVANEADREDDDEEQCELYHEAYEAEDELGDIYEECGLDDLAESANYLARLYRRKARACD